MSQLIFNRIIPSTRPLFRRNNERNVVFPTNFDERKEPETLVFHQTGIALVKQVCPAVVIHKNARMTAFGGIPLADWASIADMQLSGVREELMTTLSER